jgi:hypothetical protein
MKKGTYIASRESIPERAVAWRKLREDGYIIVSTWIDEIVSGDLGLLWSRIENEIEFSERLILYVEPDDFPLKGTLVEAGIAIAKKVPIYIVAPNVLIDQSTFRPIGSWINHPLVKIVDTVEEALLNADKL